MAVFAACDPVILKVHGDDADLQGKWRMEGDTVYFNFQKNLLELQDYTNGEFRVQFGYYHLESDTAITLEALLSGHHVYKRFLKWEAMDDVETAKVSCRCRIEELTNRRLVISQDNEMLRFDKF
jgi:hypothetical protein